MKKKPTVEQYMTLGAKCRLLHALLTEVMTDKAMLLSEDKELSKAICMISDISDIISEKEDKMFQDYPDLSNDYTSVFYGSLSKKTPDNKVDAEITYLAKNIINKCLGE